MRPGYLQKNGVPYGGERRPDRVLRRTFEPNGDSWLILTAVVEDPQYLTGRSSGARTTSELPDTEHDWEPEPCSAR